MESQSNKTGGNNFTLFNDSSYFEFEKFKASYLKKLAKNATEEDLKPHIHLDWLAQNEEMNDKRHVIYILALYIGNMISYETYKSRIRSYRENDMDMFDRVRKNIEIKTPSGDKLKFRDTSLIMAYEKMLRESDIRIIKMKDVVDCYKMLYVGRSANYVFNVVMGLYVLPFVKKAVLGHPSYSMAFRELPLLEYNPLKTGYGITIKEALSEEEYNTFMMEMNVLFSSIRPQETSYWMGIRERIKFCSGLIEDKGEYPHTVREIIERNGF